MNTSNSFYQLSPDVVMDSVNENGFIPTGRCISLNSYENRVFEVELNDSPPLIVKFYRPNRWTVDQILEEHNFLLELIEHDFPACAPLFLHNNSTLRSINDLNYAIWTKASGRQVDEYSDEDLRQLGRLLAELHNVGVL